VFRWQTYAAAIIVIAAVSFSLHEPEGSFLGSESLPAADNVDRLAPAPPDYSGVTPSESSDVERQQLLPLDADAFSSESGVELPDYGEQVLGEFEDPDGVEFDPADGAVQIIGEALDADGDDATYEPSDPSLPEDPEASAYDGGYGVQIIGESEEFDASSLVDEETVQIIGEPEGFEPPL